MISLRVFYLSCNAALLELARLIIEIAEKEIDFADLSFFKLL